MKLVVGLGNPGRKYERHRHNIGFMILDEFARKHQMNLKRQEFQSIMTEGLIEQTKVCLLKPQTFMNLSGEAVTMAKKYYKVDNKDITVVHDDVDLELGRVKLSFGSRSGGHNGVQSVIDHLGTQDFQRLRIGVGRPPKEINTADFVLSPFAQDEEKVVVQLILESVEALEELILRGLGSSKESQH